MRPKTLIVHAFLLCLLALVVWQTSRALPGFIFEVICHSVVLCFSYQSYRLCVGYYRSPKHVCPAEAGQIWLCAAVGISLWLPVRLSQPAVTPNRHI